METVCSSWAERNDHPTEPWQTNAEQISTDEKVLNDFLAS